RFMDSHGTGANFRYPMATLRAGGTLLMNGRIYVHTGSAVFAYDKNTLVQRLAANEGLGTAGNMGAPRSGDTPEAFLMPDGFFSAPYAESAAGWIIAKNDFDPSLGTFDVDDAGYVYFGYNEYGFAIARDNDTKGAGLFTPIAQRLDLPIPPRFVVVAKGNGRTYALVGDRVTETLLAFDVTDRTNPILRGTRRISAVVTAKNSTHDRVAVIDASAALRIYTGDALGEGGNQMASFPGRYSGVASDGTNFYAVSTNNSNVLVISVIEPTGATYTIKNSFEMPYAGGTFTPMTQGVLSTASYADGYLTVVGATGLGGSDLRVFRMGGARPTEIDLGFYPRNHYEVAPQPSAINGVTYSWGTAKSLNGGYNALISGLTFRSGSKDYLMVSARGLGDIYELKGSDSINVALQATPCTANPNAPVSTEPFYGDPVRAIATASNTSSIATLQWDFGNAEGTKDPNIKTGATGTAVDHRYSGIGKGGVLTRTIKASVASDSSISDSRIVTFKMPSARFGVAGIPSSKLQVTTDNAWTVLPIVVGDTFVDYSDGTVQSHFDVWSIDGAVTKTLPYPSTASVGACKAQHTLNFSAVYGPYSGTGASLLSENGADFTLGLSSFLYSVRPFAAAVEVAGSDVNNIIFKSAARFTADTSVLSAAQLAAMTYKWDLVDKNDAVLAIGPSGIGTAIPNYSVPRLILGAKGIRARLTITSPTPATGSCAGLGLENSAAYSNALDAPDPIIDGDCTAGGPPCSFTVRSKTLTPAEEVADGWTYAWSASPSTLNATTTNQKTFTPTFTAANTYTVSAVVTNAISSATAQKTVVVTKAGSNCAPMTDTNIFIAYQGMSTGCTANFSSCSANEDILFAVRPNPVQNYNFSCNPHTYSWTFAGGSSTEASPKKKFPAGTHPV
ncbi:MAG TPA: PKD domain-containing protein, partial [Thermoanaerobaculia bacterium]